MSDLTSSLKKYLKSLMDASKRLQREARKEEKSFLYVNSDNDKTFLYCYPEDRTVTFKTSGGVNLGTIDFNNSFDSLNEFLKRNYGSVFCTETSVDPLKCCFRLVFTDNTHDSQFAMDIMKTFKLSKKSKWSFNGNLILYYFFYKGIF